MGTLEEDGLRVRTSLSIAGCDIKHTVYAEDAELIFTGANGQSISAIFTKEGLEGILSVSKLALTELKENLANGADDNGSVI
ncbi:MAG: hypothetical protein M3443_06660 [Actinomycetota bacterium]|nr:hypothetical protein [Actinomycetota bacterium]